MPRRRAPPWNGPGTSGCAISTQRPRTGPDLRSCVWEKRCAIVRGRSSWSRPRSEGCCDPARRIRCSKARRRSGRSLTSAPTAWRSLEESLERLQLDYVDVERAREVNRRLARHVNVMIGNEEDFTACLGLAVEGTDANLRVLDTASFRSMIERASAEFPNFDVVATTLRAVHSATVNDWGAIAWSRDGGFVEATARAGLEILDRVGGGDSFASGLIYGLMDRGDLLLAVEYGAAHGALAMTTPGDTSTATLAEVEALVGGASARVQR